MKLYWIGVVACLVFGACGSDESQKPNDAILSEDTEENKENNSEKTELKGNVDPDEKEDYIKTSLPSNIVFSIDSVRDNYRSTNVYYIRVGNAVWNSQKNTATSSGVESVCYDEQKGNCDDFGRLYSLNGNINAVCPDGMNLPSSKDWELLESYRSEYREIGKLLSFSYGGYCEKTNGKFKCSDLNSSANYLTSDGKVYSLKNGAAKASFKSAKENGFYNILCVGYPSYVKAKKDLPACDNVKKNPPRLAYVFEEKQNFRCFPDKKSWLPDFTESCNNKGKTIVFNDTMMICENNVWQLATISESPVVCDTSKHGKVFKFNGEKYVCDKQEWRKPTGLEDSLGVCNSRKAERIDTLFQGYKFDLYYCDGSKWREAVLSDFVGDCKNMDSKHLYDTLNFKNTQYICRGNGWERYSKFDNRFGACTPKKQFMFETGTYDITDEKTQYMCDTVITYVCDTSKTSDRLTSCDSTTGEKRVIYAWKEYEVDDILGSFDRDVVTKFRGTYYIYNSFSDYWTSHNLGSIRSSGYSIGSHCDSITENHVMFSHTYKLTSICLATKNEAQPYYIATVEFPKCLKENDGETYTVDSTGMSYYCNGEKNSWRNYYDGVGKCLSDSYGKKGISTQFGYVLCEEDGWRNITEFEYNLGLCRSEQNEVVKKYKDSRAICLDFVWNYYIDKDSYRVKGKAKGGK